MTGIDTNGDGSGGRNGLIDLTVERARLALMWEGAWPWLAATGSVVVLFFVVSWLGLWDRLPPYGRIVGVVLFTTALIASLVPLGRAGVPNRRAALGRVDRASGVAHRPATSLDDRLASLAGEDSLTQALWAAHRDRMKRESGRLKAGAPSPRLAARDPYALRFALGLVAVAAFAVAGSDRGARVAAAFDWTTPVAEVAPARLDAWVAPPGYTGRPPIFLTARPGATAAASKEADPNAAAVVGGLADAVSIPANATLVIRGSGGAVDIRVTGSAQPVETDAKPPEGVTERRFKLTADAEARVATAGAPDRVWRFAIIPDRPPSITLSGPPRLNARGTANVAYEVRDDYGVAAAEARFALKEPAAKPSPPGSRDPRPAETSPPRRPLYEAPKVALSLPRDKARDGKAETPLDVTEHPFAGAEAVMTLAARDEAGQEGQSKPLEMRLPARPFVKPLARALVEQRRTLASDANAKPRVLGALRALTLFPEEFTREAGVYLGMTTAYRRLEIAATDDELRGAADYLWEIALRIEDGDLPEAERDLRAAEQALRKALENGASEQEIKKLTQDLRAALEKFMKEMAEQQRQNPGEQQQAQPGQKGKEVRPQDLRDMIDKMEKLAQQGARDAAKEALADLKNMLDNLQNAKRQQADPNAQAQQQQQQMNKLQDMIREQSKLRDQTFQQYRQNERQQRNQRSQQGKRQQSKDGEQRQQDLAQQQQKLREKLDQMMKEQGQQGQEQQEGEQQPGQKQGRRQKGGQQGDTQGEGEGEQPGKQDLGQAGKSMGEAQGSLGEGETGQALDQQQKALESLRKGAQAMADAMQGKGQPGQKGERGEQGAQAGEEGRDDDPLGRPVRRRESDGNATKVPGEIDAQRARRVLEELRKRVGESERPREELDYLERLLTP